MVIVIVYMLGIDYLLVAVINFVLEHDNTSIFNYNNYFDVIYADRGVGMGNFVSIHTGNYVQQVNYYLHIVCKLVVYFVDI